MVKSSLEIFSMDLHWVLLHDTNWGASFKSFPWKNRLIVSNAVELVCLFVDATHHEDITQKGSKRIP